MKNNQTARKHITDKESNEYDLLFPLLIALLKEVRELSKKKQDDALNKNKVKIINNVLIRIKELLKGEDSHYFLELLDLDSLPSNSDALFMLVQFESGLKQFRAKYYYEDSYGDGYWTSEPE